MNLLGYNCYIQQPSFSTYYHLYLKHDTTIHNTLTLCRLAYEIGLEYGLVICKVGCLYVEWKHFLEVYGFKKWQYPTRFIQFPSFKLESEAKRFIILLNTHCLIQVK